MNYDDFLTWLITEKKLNKRSAKDVLSRCKRISNIAQLKTIEYVDEYNLENNILFQTCSIYVKSQLKRANRLLLEWTNHLHE